MKTKSRLINPNIYFFFNFTRTKIDGSFPKNCSSADVFEPVVTDLMIEVCIRYFQTICYFNVTVA